MGTGFGELFADCNTMSVGKLVAVHYNFGTLSSMTTDYILVTPTAAKEIKLMMPTGRISKEIEYFQRPVIASANGNLVEVTAEGFKSDDANCCPSYQVTYQYKLVNDRLIPVRLLKAERSAGN